MSFETILFDIDAGVATLTLNRPDVLNSFNAQMHEEIRAALKQVGENDEVRAMLLTGAGRAFSAGQDLGDRAVGAPADLAESLEKNYNRLVRSLRELELPVVCAVNGVAAGAGANIALACDIVLAARSADFIQAFVRIGLVPDAGGSYILPRLVGRARATALAMLGEKLPAETAEGWGLIWKCVDDDAPRGRGQGAGRKAREAAHPCACADEAGVERLLRELALAAARPRARSPVDREQERGLQGGRGRVSREASCGVQRPLREISSSAPRALEGDQS